MYWVSMLNNLHFRELNPRLYGHEDCSPGQRFGPHTRDHWLIHRVDRGKGTFLSDGQAFSVKEGQIFIIHPGVSTLQIADREDPWVYHWIGFDGTMGERLRELPPVMDAPLPNRFETMDMVEAYGNNRELFLLSQLCLFFCDLFPGRTEDLRIRRIQQYIREHYMSRQVIEELAKELNLDRHYLSRYYRRETGNTMKDYVLQIRLTHAQSLLRQGRSCTETAELLGYSDTASFSRAYCRYFGTPPSGEPNTG